VSSTADPDDIAFIGLPSISEKKGDHDARAIHASKAALTVFAATRSAVSWSNLIMAGAMPFRPHRCPLVSADQQNENGDSRPVVNFGSPPHQPFADFTLSHFACRSSEHVAARPYFLERFITHMLRLILQDLTGEMTEASAEDEAPEAKPTKTALTLQEVYCLVHSCDPDEFVDHLFWRSLYPHALPFALSINLLNPDYFRFERELIGTLGSASSQPQLDAELAHFNNRRVLSWSRGPAHIRLSTERLARIASSYLNLVPSGSPIRPMAA
jgi:hypothetical protein